MPAPQRPNLHARDVAGFTLVELLVVLAVLSVLAALAAPTFFEAIRKGRRADAVAGLAQLQQTQERWRANNSSYASDLAALSLGANSPSRHYTLAVNAADATGYTITATAVSGSSQSADGDCRAMRITMANGNLSYSAMCSSCSAFNAADPARCWSR